MGGKAFRRRKKKHCRLSLSLTLSLTLSLSLSLSVFISYCECLCACVLIVRRIEKPRGKRSEKPEKKFWEKAKVLKNVWRKRRNGESESHWIATGRYVRTSWG